MKSLKIRSVNVSDTKGGKKYPVPRIELSGNGIAGDAHAGNTNREVSLLGVESIRKIKTPPGRTPSFGEYGENITTEGFQLSQMKSLDRLVCGSNVLEITQAGRKCHGKKNAEFRDDADCFMQEEGAFARVVAPGILKAGDTLLYHPRVVRAGIITVSDRASSGEYEDKSGPELYRLLRDHFAGSGRPLDIQTSVVADEASGLKEEVLRMTEGMDVLFTTGGTGIGPRDITPDTVRSMLDKEIPGIMEMIRVKYGTEFPNALLSRSVAGVIGQTLVYTLPGSPGALREYCQEILKTFEHSLVMLHGLSH